MHCVHFSKQNGEKNGYLKSNWTQRENLCDTECVLDHVYCNFDKHGIKTLSNVTIAEEI